ncbi:MAG: hypothetical protein GF317_04370 [Candidatus Lokiarchaeota archaeon]|nr:hypothetical protein [Candidatus Lokiarchaeota archaeon]MBD3199124.1 hypothetical protein [Candidatus Lokiarchaeota archaeon]
MESTFKEFQENHIDKNLFPKFFQAVNSTIDNVHKAMAKGEDFSEVLRVVEAESSTTVLYYHFPSKILFCSISDADDNIDKIRDIIKKIGNRFWKKHKADLEIYRTTTEKSNFQTFNADLEILTLGGTIAEDYPNLIVIKNVLQKIRSMGIINDFDYLVALKCNGETSPLEISRLFDKSKREIYNVLQKLKELEIIKF